MMVITEFDAGDPEVEVFLMPRDYAEALLNEHGLSTHEGIVAAAGIGTQALRRKPEQSFP